jgi:hypothetical protein
MMNCLGTPIDLKSKYGRIQEWSIELQKDGQHKAFNAHTMTQWLSVFIVRLYLR